ncbi:hypothetical protein F4779DRAFT_614311 [Xylariaceae sp. FL0662B]|nr:hypothetical protein F4779DRAFT_614311 [Xylariaceae sp. FL0662B]
MALVKTWIFLFAATRNCQASVHFTTTDWEVQPTEPLVLEWADAAGAIVIELVKESSEESNEATEIVSNYTNASFTWTPPSDLPTDKYVFRISDSSSFDESPPLLLSSHSSHDDPSQAVGDASHDSNSDNGFTPGVAVGISVGSTLGGILVLGLVVILIYRGRKNKAKEIDQEAWGGGEGGQKIDKRCQREPQFEMSGTI